MNTQVVPRGGTRHRLVAVARVLVWLAVAACAVIFARSIHWGSVRDAFAAADGRLLGIAAALWIGSTGFPGTRWDAPGRAGAEPALRSVPPRHHLRQGRRPGPP